MKRQGGFIGILILILVSLALLKYFFNWSLLNAIDSERGRETVSYIRDVLNLVWSYLEAPFYFIWNEVVRPFFVWAVSQVKP